MARRVKKKLALWIATIEHGNTTTVGVFSTEHKAKKWCKFLFAAMEPKPSCTCYPAELNGCTIAFRTSHNDIS